MLVLFLLYYTQLYPDIYLNYLYPGTAAGKKKMDCRECSPSFKRGIGIRD